MKALTSKAPLFFFVALLTACGGGGGDSDSDDPKADAGQEVGDCASGLTQACTCTDGSSGAQSCQNESWGQCVCDGSPLCTSGETQQCACPNGLLGAQVCQGDDWGACQCDEPEPEQPVHGELCFAPDYDCGTGTGLVCVFEQDGDTQGVCRLVCNSYVECLQSSEASQRFETDCCDITNGSKVCAYSDAYPGATCN